jgi:hypothetical protein
MTDTVNVTRSIFGASVDLKLHGTYSYDPEMLSFSIVEFQPSSALECLLEMNDVGDTIYISGPKSPQLRGDVTLGSKSVPEDFKEACMTIVNNATPRLHSAGSMPTSKKKSNEASSSSSSSPQGKKVGTTSQLDEVTVQLEKAFNLPVSGMEDLDIFSDITDKYRKKAIIDSIRIIRRLIIKTVQKFPSNVTGENKSAMFKLVGSRILRHLREIGSILLRIERSDDLLDILLSSLKESVKTTCAMMRFQATKLLEMDNEKLVVKFRFDGPILAGTV